MNRERIPTVPYIEQKGNSKPSVQNDQHQMVRVNLLPLMPNINPKVTNAFQDKPFNPGMIPELPKTIQISFQNQTPTHYHPPRP